MNNNDFNSVYDDEHTALNFMLRSAFVDKVGSEFSYKPRQVFHHDLERFGEGRLNPWGNYVLDDCKVV